MVVSPEDHHLCHVIDTMALHVLDGDCAFEQAIMERGRGNPFFNFLFELGLKEHPYYVKALLLCSGVQGDTLQRWRTEPFIMITESGRWIAPALPVFRSPGHEKESSAIFAAERSRVLLPLDHSDGFKRVEIMVWGGGALGAYLAAKKRHQFMTGLSSCRRMVLTDERPAWHVEQMPAPRLMNDMILLPTGDVLIINGASHGAAGWNNAHNPSLSPCKPNATIGHRFSALRPTHIPRMYHSSAILLPDGRILVAGSNTHSRYTFTGVAYPTELRVEAFTPYYMSKIFNCNRLANVSITYKNGKHGVGYGEEFVVRFKVRRTSERMEFHMYAPPFVTHSLSMNQRLLKLRLGNMRGEEGELAATLVVPPSSRVAPAGYYLFTVVNGGIPSKAQWMRIIPA